MRKGSYLAVALAALISLAAVYVYERHELYRVGLPLDDSYIHLQYAKNPLAGQAFVYGPGQAPTPGDTSPLWAILIAAGGTGGHIYPALAVISRYSSVRSISLDRTKDSGNPGISSILSRIMRPRIASWILANAARPLGPLLNSSPRWYPEG